MTDHEDFLQVILDHPEDDAPRLMYADWLTERFDPRGEFTRVQVHLDKNGFLSDGTPCPCQICRDLRKRERDLLQLHWRDWYYPTIDMLGTGPVACFNCDTTAKHAGFRFARGFVDEIHCTTLDFFRHAKALFRAQPITEVWLTDRVPWHPPIPRVDGYQQFRWYFSLDPKSDIWKREGHWLPACLQQANCIEVFNSADLAHAWLSDRCVDYGRKLEKLRPLKRKDVATIRQEVCCLCGARRSIRAEQS